MPSVSSSSRPKVLDSSTVMTPSLPTLSIASAIISPIAVSPAEIEAVEAICSLVSTSLASLDSSSLTRSTAASMPRFSDIGLAPAATLRRPSRTSAWASTVAVVVPSPATSSVFLATSLTSSAPIFSYGSSSSISLAMETPSLVIVGAPHFFSNTTLRPRGPSVTFTASARAFRPRSRPRRASSSYAIVLAIAKRFLRLGMTRLWSGAVPATDGLGVSAGAAPASPSRPSTHRSRVPTSFLALAYVECKDRSGVSLRAKTVNDDVGHPLGQLRVVRLHRLASDQDRLHLAYADVSTRSARFLGGAEQVVEHGQKCILGVWRGLRDVDSETGQRLDHAMVRRAPLQHHRAQKAEDRLAGPGGFKQRVPVVDETLHSVRDDGVEQRFLGRKVPVDGAGPDSGPTGDLIDRHRQALGRKGFVGDLQHPGAVPRRVGPQPGYWLSHLTSPNRLTKRGARSV